MHRIQNRIKTHMDAFKSHVFFKNLTNSTFSAEQRLSFIPAIMPIVFCFRDCLELFHNPDPKNEIDTLINIHCEEDANHWEWYLNDLKRLNLDQTTTFSDFGLFISSTNAKHIRQLFHTGYRYCHQTSEKVFVLIMFEVLEAGFTLFIEHMLVPVRELGKYESLEYFGKTHFDAEKSHYGGNWFDFSPHKTTPFQISDGHIILAKNMVSEMFRGLKRIFDQWNALLINNSNEWFKHPQN